VKPAPFAYSRPASLDEALALLREHGEEAKVLAGGQSLVPLLNMRLARPSVLVDLNRVPGLDGIEAADGEVRVGALVRQRALEGSPLTAQRLPLVAEALPRVGHLVTRNRGTVGGSIAHADAAAELPLCLLVLGGKVVVRSAEGSREVDPGEFFVTHFTTSLAPDELVVETVWQALRDGWGFAFEEIAQRRGDYGLSMAACALRVEDARVAEARVGIGSVVERPTLLETGLTGQALTAELAREVGGRAADALQPFGSVHASAAYQRHLTGVLVERALLRAWRNALEGQK
jgi:2-furoyl-CoA dehydrogenase FAD binding subunit